MHLDWMVESAAVKLAAMARETARRSDVELPQPAAVDPAVDLVAGLHFDDERRFGGMRSERSRVFGR